MAAIAEEKNVYQDAENLRVVNPDHFETLCKMHLSFLLDLQHSDFESVIDGAPLYGKENKNLFINLNKKSKIKNAESKLLTQELTEQARQLIKYLNMEENIQEEGLFRKNGKKSRQKELRHMLALNGSFEFNSLEYTAHDYANLLKTFLSELSEPLLTEAHYPAHCQIPNLCPLGVIEPQKSILEARQVEALQLLFFLLPSENRILLQDLLSLLHNVARAEASNRMNASNLATVFAPHILCPRKMTAQDLQINSSNMISAVAFMIENALQLFQFPHNLAEDAALCWQNGIENKMKTDCEVNDAVTTCMTFCDRRQLKDSSSTAEALAELYSYIQKMPDSAHKKKYLKQFKKENMIPPSVERESCSNDGTSTRKKSLADSIKKRLFSQKKRSELNGLCEVNGENLQNPHPGLKDQDSRPRQVNKKRHPLSKAHSLSSLTKQDPLPKVHATTNSSSPLLLRVRSNVTPTISSPLFPASGDGMIKETNALNPLVSRNKLNTNKWHVCNYLTNKTACTNFPSVDADLSDREEQVLCCLFDKAKIPVLKLYNRFYDQDGSFKKEMQSSAITNNCITIDTQNIKKNSTRSKMLQKNPPSVLPTHEKHLPVLLQQPQSCVEKANKLRYCSSLKFANCRNFTNNNSFSFNKSFSCSNIIINNTIVCYRETSL